MVFTTMNHPSAFSTQQPFKKKGTKIFLVLLGGVLFLLLFLGIPKKPPVQGPVMGKGADMTLSKLSFVQMRKGLKDWVLNAEEAEGFDKGQTAFLKDIFVIMPAVAGRDTLILKGSEGTLDTEGKRFSIQGGQEPVVIQWGDDYTLRTASISWSSDEERVSTDHPIVLSGHGMVVHGAGMQLSPRRLEMILRNVHVEIY